MLTRTDDLWKNNLECVKDVTVIYINLFIIVIIVSEKNWEVYFRTAPRMCTFCCIMIDRQTDTVSSRVPRPSVSRRKDDGSHVNGADNLSRGECSFKADEVGKF